MRTPRLKNFVEMNKRSAKKPSSKSLLARNSSPPNPNRSPQQNNFVNININHRNSSQGNLRNRITSANPKSRRVNSAFDNPLVPSTPPIQGNISLLTFIEHLKDFDNEEIESKATKATRAYFSESSNKFSGKVASFTEDDMHKIMENYKRSKPKLQPNKEGQWKTFAKRQVQGGAAPKQR